jgi:hypothetical protein
MFNPQNPPPNDNPPLPQQDLINLFDSYREFTHYCTFYCKATSALFLAPSIDVNRDCAEGVARMSQMVIGKSQEFDQQLRQVMGKGVNNG